MVILCRHLMVAGNGGNGEEEEDAQTDPTTTGERLEVSLVMIRARIVNEKFEPIHFSRTYTRIV